MNDRAHTSRPLYKALPTEIEGVDSRAELALDMRWLWNHGSDETWRLIDPGPWDATASLWVLLRTVSRDQIERMLADLAFRKKLDCMIDSRREAAHSTTWFQQKHSQSSLSCVAYFSMELMLSQAFRIYSGGLGNVAGSAQSRERPWRAGRRRGTAVPAWLLRQVIDKNGAQQALFSCNDPGKLTHNVPNSFH